MRHRDNNTLSTGNPFDSGCRTLTIEVASAPLQLDILHGKFLDCHKSLPVDICGEDRILYAVYPFCCSIGRKFSIQRDILQQDCTVQEITKSVDSLCGKKATQISLQ